MIETTIIIKCDGLDCVASKEIPYVDYAPKGWGEDDNGFHYCPGCWPDVQEEIAEEKSN